MARDSFTLTGASAGTTTFSLLGGTYGILVTATSWSSGSVAINAVAQNAGVAPVVTNFTANGYASVQLPPGEYEAVITSASGVDVTVSGIPSE